MTPDEMVSHFGSNLAISSAMVALTVVIHFIGLAILSVLLRKGTADDLDDKPHLWRRLFAILFVVLGLFAVHTVEIWTYAVLYTYGLDVFEDFEVSLYFSTVTFVTLGYGDVLLPRAWRLIGAIEAANGFILIGWSSAFLISVMGRLRALEHEWVDHGR